MSWKEEMIDDFCKMLEKASRENELIDWADEMENFIYKLLGKQKTEIDNLISKQLHKIANTPLKNRDGWKELIELRELMNKL
jgi:hypothetical protein